MIDEALSVLWRLQSRLEALAEQAQNQGLAETQRALDRAWKAVSRLRRELEQDRDMITEETIH